MGFIMWETEYSTIWGRFLFSVPFVLGGLIGALVSCSGAPRRSYYYLRAAACAAVCCLISFYLWPAAAKSINWFFLIGAYLAQFVLIVASVLICVRCSLINAVFYAENGIALFSIAKLIFDSVGAVVIELKIAIRPYGTIYSVLYILIAVVLYSSFYFFFIKDKREKTGLRIDLIKLLLPTSVVLAVAIIFNICLSVFTNKYNLRADIIVTVKVSLILCCILVLLVNFDVFTINRQRHEMDTIVQLNKNSRNSSPFRRRTSNRSTANTTISRA